jgi:enoyl-CoA hydratase
LCHRGKVHLRPVADVYQNNFLENWQEISTIRKPIIAAVSGFAVNIQFPHSSFPFPFTLLLHPLPRNSSALTTQTFQFHFFFTFLRPQLGGGCELALMADILLAAPNAQFGQPEVKIGTITGGGGSQRLARAVGKSRAMELTLTGRMWGAREAAEWGMASRVVGEGPGVVVREAVALAGEIAGKSQIAVQAQKEAVNAGASLFVCLSSWFRLRVQRWFFFWFWLILCVPCAVCVLVL